MRLRFIALGLGTAIALAALVWSSDKVTLQGERTVYTGDCRGGSWQGNRCTGSLVAADRFRFRALRAHREVLFWTVGLSGPSGKFTDCAIEDGRNWTCKANAAARQTITLQMSRGTPVHDSNGGTRPFHALSKWRWFMLRWGLPAGSDADE